MACYRHFRRLQCSLPLRPPGEGCFFEFHPIENVRVSVVELIKTVMRAIFADVCICCRYKTHKKVTNNLFPNSIDM